MKRITKIKWLKLSVIIGVLFICLYAIAQDEPAGHTTWFGLRYWDEGDHPGADSVNQNLIDIDLHLHNRDKRIDSLKGAYTNMFNFPAGTWKKYDSTVFDNDTMKFKTGVVPLLSANNNFSGDNSFNSGEVKFDASGPGGTNLNFIYDNDLGGVFIKKNNSTTLLEFNETDGLYWQFKYPVTVNGNVDITGNYMVNGVPISSGGGDAYLTNRQTFTKRNVFSDTLKADGLSLIDNARITSNLNVTGDVISDLNFLKGSSTSIGTISTDSLAFITNNTKRIVINKNGYTNFTDTVQMSDYVQVNGNLNVGSNIVATGNITADSIAGIGKFITSINAGNLSSGTILQSRLSDSVYKLSNLDTTRFLDQSDTSKFFRVGDIFTPIYEVVNSIVTFAAAVTFTVSPIFSAVVNFPYGITTTTITASSTATFNGFTKLGENGTYVKEKTWQFPLDTVNRTYSRSLGFDWRNFKGFISTYVKHDSGQYFDKKVYNLGYNSSANVSVGLALYIDSLNVNYYFPNSWGLVNDTMYITARYTNTY